LRAVSRPVLFSLLLIGGICCVSCGRPCKGPVLEKWETGNSAFKLRAESCPEKGVGFVLGAYYVFSSAPQGTDTWRTIMTFRHDDPVPIPREQLRIVGENFAYIFIGWMYAVTTDGGRTWSVWDAGKDLPNWQCCNYGLIKEVSVRPDGTGEMILSPIPGRRGEVPKVCTVDFGRHWAARCN
jgi:hypothetical protein